MKLQVSTKLRPGERRGQSWSGRLPAQLMTQDEVAAILHCTRQNVQITERKALLKVYEGMKDWEPELRECGLLPRK